MVGWWPGAIECQPQSLLVLDLIGTWLGLSLGGFGTKGVGPGLEIISGLSFILKLPIPICRTKAGTPH